MTVLGKILAIFVLLLSLVWCGLVVTGHVARTNWKADSEAYRKKATEAAAAATEARADLEKVKKAYDAQIANLVNDKKTLDAQVTRLTLENQNGNNANQQLVTQINSLTASNAVSQANLKQAGTQNDILTEQTVRFQKERDDAQIAQKKAEAAELAIKLEADGIKKQNEQYQNRLLAINEELRNMRTGANKPGGARVVPVPEGVRGTVDKVTGEYVSITLGADAAIREGAELDVVRYGATPVFLGTLRIVQVEPKAAVGQFVSKDGPTAKGDALPKTGDTVMKIGK